MQTGEEALQAGVGPVLGGRPDADQIELGGQSAVDLIEERGFTEAPLPEHRDIARFVRAAQHTQGFGSACSRPKNTGESGVRDALVT